MSIARRRLLQASGIFGTLGLIGISAPSLALGPIDFTTRGSLTIHKRVQPDTPGEPGTGGEQKVDAEPLSGAVFTVTQVTTVNGLDVTTQGLQNPDVWHEIGDFTTADELTLGTDVRTSDPTGKDGITKVSDLPVGIYLVTETVMPYGAIGSQPFLVSIPRRVAEDWLYDLVAYPKNQTTGVAKRLDTGADAKSMGQMDEIVWNITGDIAAPVAPATTTEVRHTDTMDERMEFVRIQNATFGGTKLVEGTHYSVTGTGREVEITLLNQGLALVTKAGQLGYQIVTRMREDAALGNGVFYNHVEQYVADSEGGQVSTHNNDPDGPGGGDTGDPNDPTPTTEDPTDPNNPGGNPKSYWGEITIHKTDSENGSDLRLAEFQVFATEQDALARANPISVSGEDTFVTGEDGTVVISALNASAAASRQYWLVETKPPAGYREDLTPRAVTVTPGETTKANNPVQTWENTPETMPVFARTGSAGGIAGVLLGTGLLGGGVALNAKRQADKKAAATATDVAED